MEITQKNECLPLPAAFLVDEVKDKRGEEEKRKENIDRGKKKKRSQKINLPNE